MNHVPCRFPTVFFFVCSLAFAQYKTEPAGAPPADLAAGVTALLQKDGVKVVAADGKVLCEVWMRAAAPAGAAVGEENATLTTVPQGALIGAIRFPEKGADRRGQPIKPGTYTLRYSLHPVNGDHQGVAPQRDFALLTPAAADTDAAALPKFEPLVEMSKKASGTPHPAVLSIWKQEPADFKPGFEKVGAHDWVLQSKIGEIPVALILVGQAEG